MSTKTQRALLAGAAITAVLVLGQLSQGEAKEQDDWLTTYCTDAAVWQAEEARGVPLELRTGQPDYKGIAENSCPGMRPAGPALPSDYSPARLAMPETVPFNQFVQF
ncbi:hypothetical protein [Halomonas sp. MES3-P3E]|uniref:hypothetical protein n=1 Tax=Halomonas sp. MES3-P3E TaxID=2058321 RepID=UPI000C32F038|nr:hypothetical protein [Halomonas sp. MES3-P3E]PKG49640.1 hypothetical protein CXF87_12060 [Halomonas sp. MES3-P3E]